MKTIALSHYMAFSCSIESHERVWHRVNLGVHLLHSTETVQVVSHQRNHDEETPFCHYPFVSEPLHHSTFGMIPQFDLTIIDELVCDLSVMKIVYKRAIVRFTQQCRMVRESVSFVNSNPFYMSVATVGANKGHFCFLSYNHNYARCFGIRRVNAFTFCSGFFGVKDTVSASVNHQ